MKATPSSSADFISCFLISSQKLSRRLWNLFHSGSRCSDDRTHVPSDQHFLQNVLDSASWKYSFPLGYDYISLDTNITFSCIAPLWVGLRSKTERAISSHFVEVGLNGSWPESFKIFSALQDDLISRPRGPKIFCQILSPMDNCYAWPELATKNQHFRSHGRYTRAREVLSRKIFSQDDKFSNLYPLIADESANQISQWKSAPKRSRFPLQVSGQNVTKVQKALQVSTASKIVWRIHPHWPGIPLVQLFYICLINCSARLNELSSTVPSGFPLGSLALVSIHIVYQV